MGFVFMAVVGNKSWEASLLLLVFGYDLHYYLIKVRLSGVDW